MPISEKNANRYNLRRAKAFADAGVNDSDLRYAHPEFAGKSHGDCSLCGKKGIMWHFRLRFDKPELLDAIASIEKEITRTEAVVFHPVGSECIKDWFEALPESKDKLEFLIRWERELRKCNTAKAEQAFLAKIGKLGYDSTEALADEAEALEKAAPNGTMRYRVRQEVRWLVAKLRSNRLLTPTKLGYLVNRIGEMKARQQAVSAAPVEPVAPVTEVPAAPVDQVLADATALLADPERLSMLNDYDRGVVQSIVAKVNHYNGRFASDRQRNYLAALVKKAKPQDQPTETESCPAPGEEGFVSASGIAGARY